MKIPAVQNWLGHKITDRLSRELKTKVTVKKVGFSLFNKMDIEGLYIEDLHQDTLLYAGLAQVKITDWFFMKDNPELSYIGLSNAVIHTNRNDSIWNYQFILDRFSSKSKDTSTKNGINLSLKKIFLSNIQFIQKDNWLGQYQEVALEKLTLSAKNINAKNKQIHITDLDITKPVFKKYDYASLKPPTISTPNETVPPGGKHWKLFGWDIEIGKLNITDGTVLIDKETERPAYTYFDGKHMQFTGVNINMKDLRWNSDTINFTTSISAKEKSGLVVEQLNAAVKAYPNTIEFNQLFIKTPNSTIEHSIAFTFNNFNEDISDFIHKIEIDATLKNTKVSSKDLAFFAPNVKALQRDFLIEGKLSGTVDKFRTSNLFLKTGNTICSGNLSMTGLPNLKETYIDFNNGFVQTNYTDLVSFVPSLKKVKGIDLQQLSQINYKGNFTGFVNDFVTYGTLQTNLGTITSDINMKLPENGLPGYSGKIATNEFNLGRLLQNAHLGSIGFNGKIVGTGFDLDHLIANIDGNTTKLQYDNYTYHNITTKGKMENRKFLGSITANDENLVATLNGLIDFNNRNPVFDLKANIEKSNFKKLQFMQENYSLTGEVILKFSGSNIDNFDGTILLNNAIVKKDNKVLALDYLKLNAEKTMEGRSLTISSNQLEGYVKGKFTFANLTNAFSSLLHRYYPSIFKAPKRFDNDQNFIFDLSAKNLDDYTAFLGNKYKGFNNAHIKGSINTNTNEASFHGDIPEFSLNDKYVIQNLVLDGYGVLDSLVITSNIGKLTINDSLDFYNTSLNIQTINTESVFNLSTIGDKTLNKLDFNGNMIVYPDGVQLLFNPSSFTINGKDWILEKNGELILRESVIAANDLKFSHNNQEIVIRSDPDDEGNHSNLMATVKDLEIGDFTPFFVKSNKFSGKLNGTIKVSDPIGKPIFSTTSYITDFWKDADSIGRIDLTSTFDIQKNKVDYNVSSQNPDYLFKIIGSYDPNDSTGTTIRNKIQLNGTNAGIIETYLSGVFKNIKGAAFGELEIFGNAKKQFILGAVEIKDSLKMTLKYTNVTYLFNPGIINFNADAIEFSSLKIRDTLQNKGLISRGRIYHDGFFKEMRFDIEINSDKMLLMNTNQKLNPVFYGYALADAKVKIKGPIEDLNLDIVVNDPSDANITLNTNTQSKTLGKADFIEFKTYGKEMGNNKKIFSSNMSVNMLLNANPKAKIKVILDELAGDNITARGNGNIKLGISSSGDVTINGSYTVEEGEYDFSLQSWFRKPFTIQKGSTINWAGNPYDATININAKYLAPKVSLNDLINTVNSTTTYTTADLEVTALMTNTLAKPDIKFGINYVNNTQSSNPEIETVLDLIRKDENVLNKQVAFLVLFDRLLPYSTAVNIGNEGLAVGINTLSGLLAKEATNAINRLLKDAFKSGNLQANIDFRTYSPGGIQYAVAERASSNIGLQWNWLDNRTTVYISGNFDFGILGNQSTFQLLPNFLLEYKLRPDGTIVGTLFHRQALDALQTDTERNKRLSSGGGIAWRKESDDFWALFGLRKKKKIEIPKK